MCFRNHLRWQAKKHTSLKQILGQAKRRSRLQEHYLQDRPHATSQQAVGTIKQRPPCGTSTTTQIARTRLQSLRRRCYPRFPQNLCLVSLRCQSFPRVRRRGVAFCLEERCHRACLFDGTLGQHFPGRYLPGLSSRRFSAALAKSDQPNIQGHARPIVVAASQSKAWGIHIPVI